MEIIVKMDEAEFKEYQKHRETRDVIRFALERIQSAVAPAKEKMGQWDIVNHEHLSDAVFTAKALLE